MTTNSAGFRGREIAQKKQLGATRVLVLGDSYVWGFGVQDDEVFTSRMESFCPGIEAVNFGVSGYSTDQELLLYRDKGAAYGPDVVVLVLAGNDYEDNARSKVYVYYHKPAFILDGDRLVLTNDPVPQSNVLLRTLAQIAQRSYVLTQMNRTIEAMARGASAAPKAAPTPGQATEALAATRPFPRTAGQAITVRLVRELATAVRSTGSQFVVVFTDGQGEVARELTRAVADPAIVYVYLDDVFREAESGDLHLPQDFHWNAAGHALVAQTVTRALVEHAKVPSNACPIGTVRTSISIQ
ncbi:MAG TPA: SGNH/GDSL hydrolase family protein [Burkholderiaceae bacterium]|nr:SGNH/GDSL hydrolase family protein [Burkholderiaceae bacterium]